MKQNSNERATLKISEVAKEIGINEIAAYELAKQPGFPAFFIGKRIIVPREAFMAWLNNSAFEKKNYSGKFTKRQS